MRVLGKLAILALVLGSSVITVPGCLSNANSVRTNQKMRFYLVDTHQGTASGSILVYEASSGDLITKLPTRYSPEIALSRDGRLLFVCDTQIEAAPPQSEVRVYNTKNFDLLQRSPSMTARDMYTTGPAATSLVASEDGRYVYVPRSERQNGQWSHTYITYDVRAGTLLPQAFQLPERAAIVTVLAGRPELLFGLDGDEMEAIAWADPVKQHAFETVFTFDHPFERGLEYMMTELGAAPDGNLGYVVTRNGRLRVVDLKADKVMPEMKLRLPEDAVVPIGDLIVTQDYLLVPISTKEVASIGVTESVCVFDRWTLKSLRSINLSTPGSHLVLSPDGTKLYVSSDRYGAITTYDFVSGKPVVKLENAAETLVWFTAAPNPE
jgi:DNA-binding beta-propeller fold protein YncE